jgi:hypothetical protein
MRILIIACSLFCSVAYAGLIPPEHRAELVRKVLSIFWGNARDSSGAPIMPKDERDRATVPISQKVADRVIVVGEISGMAVWCKLQWDPWYRSLTRAARNNGMNDKQVAFVSVLHGTVQQAIASGMESKPCSAAEKARVGEALQQPIALPSN